MRIEIDMYHPGIPGFDATYRFQVFYTATTKEHCLTTAEFYLECNVPEIEIYGDKVTVPAAFKDNTDITEAIITAYHRKDRAINVSYVLPIKRWDRTISDEFDGDSLNKEMWTINAPYSFEQVGDGKGFSNSEETVNIVDGNLVMHFQKAKNPRLMQDGTYKMPDYNLGSCVSTFNQKFGCFQTSMLLPGEGAPGCNPAFWLIPAGKGYNKAFFGRHTDGPLKNKYCGEIDIIEYSPQWVPAKYVATDHWWDGVDKYTEGDSKYYEYQPLWKDYVNIALVWTEDALYYYCDGQLVRSVLNLDTSESEAARVYLSLGASGYGEKNSTWIGHFTDENIDKAKTYFDYVRLFK